jgi:hypothetical protein
MRGNPKGYFQLLGYEERNGDGSDTDKKNTREREEEVKV